jgi:hypothetical protein
LTTWEALRTAITVLLYTAFALMVASPTADAL